MGKKNKLKKAREEYFESIRQQNNQELFYEIEETEEEIKEKEHEYDVDTAEIIRERIFNYLEKDNSQICEYLTFKNTCDFVKLLVK